MSEGLESLVPRILRTCIPIGHRRGFDWFGAIQLRQLKDVCQIIGARRVRGTAVLLKYISFKVLVKEVVHDEDLEGLVVSCPH